MTPRRAATTVLTEAQRDRAKRIGATLYPRSKRYRVLREKHVFAALDAAVAAMEKLRFTNPYDGRVLGGLATVMFENDPKAIGYLRHRKVKALDSKDDRKELWELIGLLIAENYLKARKDKVPDELRLSDPRAILGAVEELFEQMASAGQAMANESVLTNEMAVRFEDLDDPTDIALALINDAIGEYESLVPEAADGEHVPNSVERRAIAKAAFLRLGVEDLEKQSAEDGMGDLPTKDAMAQALAEKYVDRLDDVAQIVLSRIEGDPDSGLVTRILPLKEPPSLDAAERAFRSLKGRYLETRTASFFIFRDVEHSGRVLRVRGKVRSFSVNPAEAGGKAQLNFRPFNDELVITLRDGEAWAEVNARRTSDLSTVRSVLRRTGEVLPALALQTPDPLTTAPYNRWDTRTLWMLDFLRQDLRSKELSLDNTHMAHFLSPDAGKDAAEDASERPSVEAVRLFGTQLHDHPEACTRIADRARLRDLEVRVRQVYDLGHGYSRLVRFRLGWDDDHLSVATGTGDDDTLDATLHRQIVRLVRQAASRKLDENALKFTLRRIERRAGETELADDEPGVLDDEDEEAS